MRKYHDTFHLIEVHFVGATNFRGSRVTIRSSRFKKSRTFSYDYEKSDILEQACDWLEEQGFKIKGVGELSKGYFIITDTFKTI
jgi:hypothetical protein